MKTEITSILFRGNISDYIGFMYQLMAALAIQAISPPGYLSFQFKSLSWIESPFNLHFFCFCRGYPIVVLVDESPGIYLSVIGAL